MGFRAVEDRPTPTEVYNLRIYLSAVVIAWGALTFGYDSAFLGTTITRASFVADFGIDKMTKTQVAATSSNITSTFQAAAFFGSLFSWLIMEKWGRKPTLQISSIIFVIGAVLMTAATHQLALIYTGRALTGIGCGGITAVVPTMIAEISPPAIRGQLTGFFEISYQIGSVIGFWINYGISVHYNLASTASWRIPMAVQIIPGGVLMLGCFMLRESPQFLIKAGKHQKAIENLTWMRQLDESHHYIQEELDMINQRLEEERAVSKTNDLTVLGYMKGALREVLLPGIRNRMVIVFFMFMLQNFSGAAAINYYSPTLFNSIGVSGLNVTLYTGIYGLIKAVASIVFYIFFIDTWGRRQPWMVSNVLCMLCLLYLGVYVKVGHPSTVTASNSESTVKGGKAAVAFIMLYSAFWSFGMNGLPWIISAEMFAVRLRSLTGAYAAMCQWLGNYVITKALPYIVLAMGKYGVWFFFVGCLALSAVFGFFFVKETKGVPIEEMDRRFGFIRPDIIPGHRRGTLQKTDSSEGSLGGHGDKHEIEHHSNV